MPDDITELLALFDRASSEQPVTRPQPTMRRAFHKIMEGLNEALDVAKGKAKPAKIHQRRF